MTNNHLNPDVQSVYANQHLETEPGEELVQQNSHAEFFYFLYQGTVSATLVCSDSDSASEPLVSTLGSGKAST